MTANLDFLNCRFTWAGVITKVELITPNLGRRVEPTCPTSKVLRKGDILLQFDGTEIGCAPLPAAVSASAGGCAAHEAFAWEVVLGFVCHLRRRGRTEPCYRPIRSRVLLWCGCRRYDGTVAFRSGERINFSYLVSEKQNNDTVQLVIHHCSSIVSSNHGGL